MVGTPGLGDDIQAIKAGKVTQADMQQGKALALAGVGRTEYEPGGGGAGAWSMFATAACLYGMHRICGDWTHGGPRNASGRRSLGTRSPLSSAMISLQC